MEQRWPARLWIIRHGQSAGNVARDAADAAGLTHIDIADRDMDVALSELGHQQAQALGRWFARQPQGERPHTLMASPYLRAVQTGQAIRDAGGMDRADRPLCVDERLREKEFGVLDRLTRRGIRSPVSRPGRVPTPPGQVLSSPPRRGELVRCDPPAAQPDRHAQPSSRRGPRHDRGAPSGGSVSSLSAGRPDRSRASWLSTVRPTSPIAASRNIASSQAKARTASLSWPATTSPRP